MRRDEDREQGGHGGSIVGFRYKMNNRRDQICMQRYITRVSKSGLDMPTMLNLEQFLPAGAPLLDHQEAGRLEVSQTQGSGEISV